MPGHGRRLTLLLTFLYVGYQTAPCSDWTLCFTIKCLMLRRMKELFFVFTPCTFLTAPSSCVTLVSYPSSIKGFLMTRVDPEHGERCGAEDQKARLYLNLLTLAFVVGRTFQQISRADQRHCRRSFTAQCAQCQHPSWRKVGNQRKHTKFTGNTGSNTFCR